MTLETLENRLAVVEAELTQLKKRVEQDATPTTSWLDEIFGVFKDDPLFDEAERYGREWRESQRMEYDDDANTPA